MPGGRGGRRTGKVGKAYGQRSDLQGGKLPATAVPGQGYGVGGAQMAAQSAVPMGSPSVAPAGPPGPLPAHIPMPGSLGDIFGDSQDPNEHVMSGAALGPGPGPEAFGFGAQATSAADVARLARWLPALEVVANRPGSTDTTRQIVRALKAKVSMLPPNVGA